MSEFNSKRYYGYSMGNDPGLSTTTKNFEFQHTRAEYLDRAIRKVQKPELAQKKMFLMEKFSRLRRPEEIQMQLRDMDIETQISNFPMSSSRIRNLSQLEIDNLIEKVKSNVAVANANSGMHKCACTMHCQHVDPKLEQLKCNAHIKCKHNLEHENRAAVKQLAQVTVDEYRCQTPKWVEIVEAPSKGTASSAEIKQIEEKSSAIDISDAEIDVTAQTTDSMLNSHSSYTLNDESTTAGNLSINVADCNAYNDNSNDDDDVYDSDLEYEMMQRPDYTKYCSPRPIEGELDTQPYENTEPPEFVELEPEIPRMNLSFLKNTAPMRFTELTDELHEDDSAEQPQMKVFIKNRKESDEEVSSYIETEKPVEKIIEKTVELKKKTHKATVIDKNKIILTPRTKFTKFNTNAPKTNITPRSPNKSAQSTPRQQKTPKHDDAKDTKIKPNRLKKLKKIIITRSIEELKAEKAHIFSKMTNSQERIIEILDKLKLSLVEIYVPTGLEKQKRQKNAFEFSVRFSRNYLLPLKGMIQDFRLITVEQLNSAITNEASSKILSLYLLMYQALQTYSKQIRYFLMDQLPQKLLQLIDYVHTVTNICLEKGIFDPNDAIIDCLKDRCTKLASFICDLHAERFAQKHKSTKANHANYDLKMFMNDLNMYEPILVPKNVKYRPRRQMNQRKLVPSHSSASIKKKSSEPIPVPPAGPSPMEDTSELIELRNVENAVKTIIEDVPASESSINLISTLESLLHLPERKSKNISRKSVSKMIMEALQTVTKEQVRKALDPILESLGTALETKVIYMNDKKFNRKNSGTLPEFEPEKFFQRVKKLNQIK